MEGHSPCKKGDAGSREHYDYDACDQCDPVWVGK